jgi:hypothetical protein
MTITFLYTDLLEASAQPGCPVCRLVESSTIHFLGSMFYENVNDIPARAHLRSSFGFCKEHAWQVLEGGLGDALGISIIYQDVLTNILRRLPATPEPGAAPGWRERLRQLTSRDHLLEQVRAALQALKPVKPCPACEQRLNTTRLVLAVMIDSLEKREDVAAALAASDGLCLPHLAAVLEQTQHARVYATLLGSFRQRLEELNGDLGEFIRKNDYRFRDESMGRERDAGRRAIAKITGEQWAKRN